MGLEKRKQRRKEKLYEKHCKLKAQKEKMHQHHLQHQQKVQMELAAKKGKGAQKMREMVTKAKLTGQMQWKNPFEGGKNADLEVTPKGAIQMPKKENVEGDMDVHMMSY